MLGESLEFTHGKVLGYDEGIKVGIYNGKVIGTILGYVDRITFGIDVVTELGSLDGFFDGFNYGKLEGLLLRDSLGSTHGKVLDSDEITKVDISDG